jgi:hypothetical protein
MEETMNPAPKHRGLMWAAGVIAVLYFAPSIFQSFRQAALQRPQAGIRLAAPPGTPAAAFGSLMGIWQATAALPSRGTCTLKLELRANREKEGQYSGYSTLACVPFGATPPRQPGVNPAEAMLSKEPSSAILTGSVVNGSIAFHVDKNIAAGQECAMTSFTVTPFGTNQIASEWQDGCQGGQMVLKRTGK